jgi:hypothetical protein
MDADLVKKGSQAGGMGMGMARLAQMVMVLSLLLAEVRLLAFAAARSMFVWIAWMQGGLRVRAQSPPSAWPFTVAA